MDHLGQSRAVHLARHKWRGGHLLSFPRCSFPYGHMTIPVQIQDVYRGTGQVQDFNHMGMVTSRICTVQNEFRKVHILDANVTSTYGKWGT